MNVSEIKTQPSYYRADIDGLRALAVLSVVLFHAFPDWVQGGFIGVDIFFVISGYLISSIIYKGLDDGSFSFGDFYIRRIKRIFPALIVVLISCLIFGWFFLYPEEYKVLGREIVGSVTFTNNFKFLKESGYFDNTSLTKPLLHLWSLSIEEQFYLVFPLFLWLTFKNKKLLLVSLILIIGISFTLGLQKLEINKNAAYYLTHLRIWELLMGAVLVIPRKQIISHPKWLGDISSCVGIILIAIGVFFLKETDIFPGWNALLFPCLGSLLVINSKPSSIANKILSQKAFVSVGLLSYPIYLWHWPILVFARIIHGEDLNLFLRCAIVLISILLAYATYLFIEKPIRFKNKTKVIALYLLLILFLIGGFGYLLKVRNGLSNRDLMQKTASHNLHYHEFNYYPASLNYPKCNQTDLINGDIALSYCLINKKGEVDAIIIGDSHAEDKFYGIDQNDKQHHWMLAGHLSCPPLYEVNVESDVKDCHLKSEKIINWTAKQKYIKTVFLSFYGNYFLTKSYAADQIKNNFGLEKIKITSTIDSEDDRTKLFYRGLEKTVDILTKSNKKIIIAIDMPELPFFPIDCFRHPEQSICEIPLNEAKGRQKEYRIILKKLKEKYKNLEIFDPLNIACNGSTCSFYKNESIIYRDSHHLTLKGSDQYGKDFNSFLKRIN